MQTFGILLDFGGNTYTYDTTWHDKLTAFNGRAITYDEIGNPLTYHDGTVFTWKMGRQLATAKKSDGTAISYRYNYENLRMSKTVAGKTTYYTLVGDKITSQTCGTDKFYFRYNNEDELVGFEYNDIQYYYVKNLQNDIVAILDSTGTSVVEYTYDAWGLSRGITGSMSGTLGVLNPFRYRSYYFDTETGLYYLQSRYYDPKTCRFINSDAAEMIGEGVYNLFGYCENNLVVFVDLSGHKWITKLSKYNDQWYSKKSIYKTIKVNFSLNKTLFSKYKSQLIYSQDLYPFSIMALVIIN